MQIGRGSIKQQLQLDLAQTIRRHICATYHKTKLNLQYARRASTEWRGTAISYLFLSCTCTLDTRRLAQQVGDIRHGLRDPAILGCRQVNSKKLRHAQGC